LGRGVRVNTSLSWCGTAPAALRNGRARLVYNLPIWPPEMASSDVCRLTGAAQNAAAAIALTKHANVECPYVESIEHSHESIATVAIVFAGNPL
jgi:hypothetical protein